MKNRIFGLLGVLAITAVVMTGCGTDDTISPVITLNGAEDTVIAKGSTWIDPLATAIDDEDGDISGSIVVSGSVNTNVAGVYEITYSSTDEAGNSSSIIRTVTVSWTGALLAGSYTVADTCVIAGASVPDSYTSVATASVGNSYRVLFSNLSNVFTGNTSADIVGDELTIPLQTPNGVGSDYEVSGSGYIVETGSTVRWVIQYSVREISTNTVGNCTAYFVSQ